MEISWETRMLWAERKQACFGHQSSLHDCRFSADNGKVPQIRHARDYALHWSQMAENNMGLLFWGPPGSGKTFAAACIANALMETTEWFVPTVIMATFGTILRRLLALSPMEKQEYMDTLLTAGLLILDDLGMERQTEYAQEQVFSIVDGRYLNRRPLIVTTNLSLQDLKNPQTLAQSRIYDRLLEQCVPVFFDGQSQRRDLAAEKMCRFRELTAESL